MATPKYGVTWDMMRRRIGNAYPLAAGVVLGVAMAGVVIGAPLWIVTATGGEDWMVYLLGVGAGVALVRLRQFMQLSVREAEVGEDGRAERR